MKKRVAVFDIDGTIFRSSLLIELVNELIDRKSFPAETREEYEKEYLAWLDRKGGYQEYIKAVVDVFMKYIKEISYDKLMEAVEVVIEHHKGRVYRYTRDLIKKLKSEDYFLLAISNSPKSILDGFGQSLGFDKIYGTIYETDDTKRFTGKIINEEIIFDKSKILARAIEKENLTLEGSVGVGDTEGDIKFLEMVENPICFNPNSLLYVAAKERGWKVVVERKDVIYEL